MKQMISLFTFFLLAPLLVCSTCYGSRCYLEGDLGSGAMIEVPSNPSNKMMQIYPKANQVVEWLDTGLFASGKSLQSDGTFATKPLEGYVTGKWYPWGEKRGVSKKCQIELCSGKSSLAGIEILKSGCLNSDTASGIEEGKGGQLVITKGSNIGCHLENGIGLYGLIASPTDGLYVNHYKSPNDSVAISANPPGDFFRTFHIGSITNENGKFVLQSSMSCKPSQDESKIYECSHDQLNDSNYVTQGRIFVKILDSHYEDNYGNYTLSFLNGVYKIGFVQQAIQIIDNQINMVSKSLFQSVIKEMAKYISVVLTLFLAFNGITFMMGISSKNKTEMLMLLIKIAFVGSLLGNAETIYEFMSNHFFRLFSATATTFSDVIVNSTSLAESEVNISHSYQQNELTGTGISNLSYLAQYDSILNTVISPAVNIKIISLLFTWKFYFIPLLYILLGIMIIAVLKALSLYVISILQTALLIVIFPIFVVFLLFKQTTEFFKNWVSGMTNSAMLVIITTAAVALISTAIHHAFDHLFHYKSCYEILWQPKIFGFTLFTFSFWAPSVDGQIESNLTAYNYLYALLLCVLFNKIIDSVAKLSDSLSNATFSPSSHMYGQMTDKGSELLSTLQSHTTGAIGNKITELNVQYGLGKLGDKIDTGVDQDGKENFGGKAVRIIRETPETIRSKITQIFGGDNK